MIFFSLSVLTNYLSVRVQGETVLKFNTAVLRCQVPQSAATYTKIISWTRGSTRLYPSTRGGNMTRSMFFFCLKYLYNTTLKLYIIYNVYNFIYMAIIKVIVSVIIQVNTWVYFFKLLRSLEKFSQKRFAMYQWIYALCR